MEYETKTQPETARAAIESLGLTMTAEFVPYSESKDAKPSPKLNDLSLNWRVTIYRTAGDDRRREVLTSDYSAGIAHAPSDRPAMTDRMATEIREECEKGRKAGLRLNPPLVPKIEDVLSCLVSDADAIEHPTFESWASDLGYDPDSRKAEATYRACLEIGLKLRAALGDEGLKQLRDAFQDY